MKTISIYFVMAIVLCSFRGYSQIKVYDDNRVKLFGDKPEDDVYKDLSLQVYGKYNDFLSNGRIGFGDYNGGGFLLTKRIYIGEAGIDFDSDRLELCGSSGIYFTWGQGYDYNNVIAKLDLQYSIINNLLTNTSKFKFSTDVYAHGLVINSDERFKDNIRPLEQASQKILGLNPVSYNLKPDISLSISEAYPAETEKEKTDTEEFVNAKLKFKKLEDTRFGFIAQELEGYVPEAVDEEDDGLYVDYIGLLPLLVETIKEQQKQIASLTTLIKKSK